MSKAYYLVEDHPDYKVSCGCGFEYWCSEHPHPQYMKPLYEEATGTKRYVPQCPECKALFIPFDDKGWSRYRNVWKPHSNNKPFWDEALIGRRITKTHFKDDSLVGIELDDGQVIGCIYHVTPRTQSGLGATFYIKDP